MEKQKIISKVKEQSDYTYKVYQNIIERQKTGRTADTSVYAFERAKLLGMITLLDTMGIDRTQFNWIF
jgi:hypothetical protein